MDRNQPTNKQNHKRIMANTSAIWHMLHVPLTNYHLLAAKQEPYQKACLFMKILKKFLEKSGE